MQSSGLAGGARGAEGGSHAKPGTPNTLTRSQSPISLPLYANAHSTVGRGVTNPAASSSTLGAAARAGSAQLCDNATGLSRSTSAAQPSLGFRHSGRLATPEAVGGRGGGSAQVHVAPHGQLSLQDLPELSDVVVRVSQGLGQQMDVEAEAMQVCCNWGRVCVNVWVCWWVGACGWGCVRVCVAFGAMVVRDSQRRSKVSE
jgi:hypothetical protein